MAIREVIFRGKRTDNGEWIYGYVNQHRGESILDCMCEQINSDDFYIYDYAAKIDTGIYGLLYKIIPETVGQYTGLTDKNGVKIFDGDIVKAFTRYDTQHTNAIIYRNGVFWFGNWNWVEFLDRFRYAEVIGNIHDNPELLEGGGDNG